MGSFVTLIGCPILLWFAQKKHIISVAVFQPYHIAIYKCENFICLHTTPLQTESGKNDFRKVMYEANLETNENKNRLMNRRRES